MIYYLSNKDANPICRDAGVKFAESLGFIPINQINNNIPRYSNIIVEIGWLSEDYIEFLSGFNFKESNVVFRIVDNYKLIDNKYSQWIYDVLKDSRVVCPYKIKLFGLIDTIWIPYHYEESGIPLRNPRIDKAILTGARLEHIYPLRESYYLNRVKSKFEIVTLDHPGYSGKSWNQGKLGRDFIEYLSQYKYMVLTTSNEQYELLKYVECAEAGCSPIGELPLSLKEELPKELVFNIYNEIECSEDYRYYISQLRNKELILNKYNELFNS